MPLSVKAEVRDSKEYVSDVAARKMRLVPNGTLLVSFKLTLGRLAFAGRDLYTNEAIASLLDLKETEVQRDYLYWFLNYFDWDKAAAGEDKIKGKTLNKAKLKILPILVPPLEEQKRIVAILDEAFEGLARAREHAEANMKNARELFVSFVRGAFPENKAVWRNTTLPEICQNLDNKRIPITKSARVAGDTPYYGASGIVDYVRDYIFDEDLLLVSEDGANLLARAYPIAFSISGKTWVNNHAHVLRFETVTDQMFVELYLNSISLKPFISGMAQPKLNQNSLNRIPIPFPPEAERKLLVEKAGAMSADSNLLAGAYSERIENIEILCQSLLHKAFSGQLT